MAAASIYRFSGGRKLRSGWQRVSWKQISTCNLSEIFHYCFMFIWIVEIHFLKNAAFLDSVYFTCCCLSIPGHLSSLEKYSGVVSMSQKSKNFGSLSKSSVFITILCSWCWAMSFCLLMQVFRWIVIVSHWKNTKYEIQIVIRMSTSLFLRVLNYSIYMV